MARPRPRATPRGRSRHPEMALERWAGTRFALAGVGRNISGVVGNSHVIIFDHTA
jgi:hypothetical protein